MTNLQDREVQSGQVKSKVKSRMIYQTAKNWELLLNQGDSKTNRFVTSSLFIRNLNNNPQYTLIMKTLTLIHRMRVIEGEQLFRLIGLKRATRDFLVRNGLLVCHKLVCKKYTLYVYALHQNATKVLTDLPPLPLNYSESYSLAKVLQILSAIEFYILFRENKKNCFFRGGTSPFQGKILYNDKGFDIYCMRDSVMPLEEYLRMNTKLYSELENGIEVDKFLFILCENIQHIKPLIQSIEKSRVKVRIVDESLFSQGCTLEETFYYIEGGDIHKERLRATK